MDEDREAYRTELLSNLITIDCTSVYFVAVTLTFTP
jgi:hypothetical protein